MRLVFAVLCLVFSLHLSANDKVAQVLFQNVCVQCHGAAGEGKAEVQSPSIAGLPAWYVLRQLESFRSGLRGGEDHGAAGVLMAAAAKALPADHLQNLALHVEKLPIHPVRATKSTLGADLAAGKLLYEERCMECHRYNASGEIVFGSPPLIGLQDWYLMTQIHNFKEGRRGVMKNDPNGAKMVFSSQFIESDQDAKNVVAYILSLNPKATSTNENRLVGESISPFEEAEATDR